MLITLIIRNNIFVCRNYLIFKQKGLYSGYMRSKCSTERSTRFNCVYSQAKQNKKLLLLLNLQICISRVVLITSVERRTHALSLKK